MKTKIVMAGTVTIGLRGGNKVERECVDLFPIFDPAYGPTTIFVVEKKGEKVTICRMPEENDSFVRNESITLAELEELRKESKKYIEEGVEEEIEGLNEQIEEVFMGGLEKLSSKQVEIFDVMFG